MKINGHAMYAPQSIIVILQSVKVAMKRGSCHQIPGNVLIAFIIIQTHQFVAENARKQIRHWLRNKRKKEKTDCTEKEE